jgi:hypothetical protein
MMPTWGLHKKRSCKRIFFSPLLVFFTNEPLRTIITVANNLNLSQH